ncbi:MAG: hypothetical protein ABI626_04255 [Sphingomicrobium sp.]
MRLITGVTTAAFLLGACAQRDGAEASRSNAAAGDDGNRPSAPSSAAQWTVQSSGEGVALALLGQNGETVIQLLCPAGLNRLLVNVQAFKPIASEERLSFGSGGTVAALVADPRGDTRRGGLSGTGQVPDDLKELVSGPIAARYGAQHSGPHPAPPAETSGRFVTACFAHMSAALQAAAKPTASTSPCLVQDGELLRLSRLKAVGTEPFWAARIEGRCVTYANPDEQAGTRVWTKFNSGLQGGVWIGALGGKPFELRTRPQSGCSDGMSDKSYPIAVALTVNGERRSGCAEPL